MGVPSFGKAASPNRWGRSRYPELSQAAKTFHDGLGGAGRGDFCCSLRQQEPPESGRLNPQYLAFFLARAKNFAFV